MSTLFQVIFLLCQEMSNEKNELNIFSSLELIGNISNIRGTKSQD